MKRLAVSQSQLGPIKKINHYLIQQTLLEQRHSQPFRHIFTIYYHLNQVPQKKKSEFLLLSYATHSSVNEWSSGTETAVFLGNFSFLFLNQV